MFFKTFLKSKKKVDKEKGNKETKEEEINEPKKQVQKDERSREAKEEERKQWGALPCENLELFMMIHNMGIWEYFVPNDLRNTSLVCKKIWTIVAPYMENRFFFKPSYRQVNYYIPKKISTPTKRHISAFSPFTHLIMEGVLQSDLDFLPPSLSHLHIGFYNMQYLSLPPSLTHLSIDVFYPKATNYNTFYGLTFGWECADKSKIDHSTIIPLLPPSLSHLSLGFGFNAPLTDLPLSITQLSVSVTFEHSFSNLPPSLTHLTIDGLSAFRYTTTTFSIPPLYSLPPSLRFLRVSFCDYSHSYDSLPASLTTLEILGSRSIKLSNTIRHFPPSLTSLSLCHCVNQNYNNLPKSLRKLYLHGVEEFTSPLDELPSGLIELTLAENFNQPVLHLPPNIVKLNFGNSFNQPVDNLPPSLVYLSFGHNFNQPVNILPSRISYLRFSSKLFNQHVDKLPPSVIHLILKSELFNQQLDKLPNTLCFLTIKSKLFNKSLDHLPASLSTLTIHSYGFNQPLLSLPPNLTILEISNCQIYNSNVDAIPMYHVHSKPSTVLPQPPKFDNHSFLNRFNQPIILPPFLQHAILYCKFDQPLSSLPSSLVSLYLGNCYAQPLPQLPSSLHHLVLGSSYNHELHLPPSLLTLSINFTPYPHPLTVPDSLNRLGLRGKYLFPIPRKDIKVVWVPE